MAGFRAPARRALKVRAPDSDRSLVITVGKDFGVGEALGMFAGGGLLGRLRRE